MSRAGVRRAAFVLAAAGAFAGAAPAWALFDDDEARRQIAELRARSNERFDTQGRAQIELANQIEQLKGEVARLRGQVETLSYELETTKKRQQDFYIDLDGRLRKVETAPQAAAPAAPDAAAETPAPARKTDPAEDARVYEAALNQFKAGKYKDSAAAFETFVRERPDSDLAPSAQYWLGNSYYGQRECKKAIDAQKVVLTRWGTHPKAADALLNIASCQQELGEAKTARQTLEQVVAKYPGSPAAETAAKRLQRK